MLFELSVVSLSLFLTFCSEWDKNLFYIAIASYNFVIRTGIKAYQTDRNEHNNECDANDKFASRLR